MKDGGKYTTDFHGVSAMDLQTQSARYIPFSPTLLHSWRSLLLAWETAPE